DGAKSLALVAVETATPELLEVLDPDCRGRLLISGERAVALALANERDAADPAEPVLIERAPWLDAMTALAVVDPGRDLDRGPIGPMRPVPLDCPEAAKAALELARLAGLLPALWLVDEQPGAVVVAAADIERQRTSPAVELVARAKLPLEDMPDTQ